jgi:hypothetical protein
MTRMSRYAFVILPALFAVVAVSAHAQIPPAPGTSPVIPYPTAPPPPPPPPITVPQVPQMNSPPKFELQNTSPSLVEQGAPPKPVLKRQRRGPSFSDRVQRCLDEAAAIGLGPNERAAYSRSCATR